MKYRLRGASDVELGKDGSKWEHGYVPLNAAAVALKAHKHPGSVGAATPGAVKVHPNGGKKVPARFVAVQRVNYLSTGHEKVRNTYHVKDTHAGYLDHHVNEDKIFQGTKKEALAHAAFRNEQHAKGIAPTQAERRAGEERSMAKMDAERAAAGRRSLENSAKIMSTAYAPKVTANGVTGSVGNMTDVSALRAAHAAKELNRRRAR